MNKQILKLKHERSNGYRRFEIGLLLFIQFTVFLAFAIFMAAKSQISNYLQIDNNQFIIINLSYALGCILVYNLYHRKAARSKKQHSVILAYEIFVLSILVWTFTTSFAVATTARFLTGVFAGIILRKSELKLFVTLGNRARSGAEHLQRSIYRLFFIISIAITIVISIVDDWLVMPIFAFSTLITCLFLFEWSNKEQKIDNKL